MLEHASVPSTRLQCVSQGALSIVHGIEAIHDELCRAGDVVERQGHRKVLGRLRCLGERPPYRCDDARLHPFARLTNHDGRSCTPKFPEDVLRARSVAIQASSQAYEALFVDLSRVADDHVPAAVFVAKSLDIRWNPSSPPVALSTVIKHRRGYRARHHAADNILQGGPLWR